MGGDDAYRSENDNIADSETDYRPDEGHKSDSESSFNIPDENDDVIGWSKNKISKKYQAKKKTDYEKDPLFDRMGNIMTVDLEKNYSPFMEFDRAQFVEKLHESVFEDCDMPKTY